MAHWQQAYVALGSNLDHPINQVTRGFHQLASAAGITRAQLSSLYRSQAVGPGHQPDYINAAASISTSLSAHELLRLLQRIETQHHRQRDVRWGPRTLDLDLLLYGRSEINEPELVVPHPRIAERNFVLAPLTDLEPQLTLPDGRSIEALLQACGLFGLVRLDQEFDCNHDL